VETRKSTPEAAGEPEPAAARMKRGALLAAVALLAILGFAWTFWGSGREDDRHALIHHAREIEARIRSHGYDIWRLVEGNDSRDHANASQEQRHQDILRDFERLAHLDSFEMTDLEAEIVGDRGVVTYRVRGISRSYPLGPGARVTAQPVPAGGEMHFVRDGTTWRLVQHRLIELR